jgi:hypothetical protein
VPEAACVDLDGDPLVVDQRGKTRPLDPTFPVEPPYACDAGAMERAVVEFLPWIFKDGFESANSLFWSATAD